MIDKEVPSRVDGKRRNLARVSDFVSWDQACRVPRHKITHSRVARYLLFPSTSDGTCFSHDKKEGFTRFTVKLAS